MAQKPVYVWVVGKDKTSILLSEDKTLPSVEVNYSDNPLKITTAVADFVADTSGVSASNYKISLICCDDVGSFHYLAYALRKNKRHTSLLEEMSEQYMYSRVKGLLSEVT